MSSFTSPFQIAYLIGALLFFGDLASRTRAGSRRTAGVLVALGVTRLVTGPARSA